MIPQEVRDLFDGKRLIWMATTDAEGLPNAAPMLQCWWADEKTMVIGDLFLKVSKANVEATGKVCLAACDVESGKAFKMKGRADYVTSGPMYDLAQSELEKKKPGKRFKGTVVVTIEQVYDQARGENAGALIAEV